MWTPLRARVAALYSMVEATQRLDARKNPIQSPTQSYDSIDNARFVPGAVCNQLHNRACDLFGAGRVCSLCVSGWSKGVLGFR